jgi:ketosteroid isomerase-like protein
VEPPQVIHFAPMRRTGIGLAVLAVLSAATVAGLVLGGCGGDDDGGDSAAERAAQRYVDAYNDRDFKTVCSMLTDSYKDERQFGPGGAIEREEGQLRTGCPQYFAEHTSGAPTSLTLDGVEERGNVATANLRSESEDAPGEAELTLALARQPDGSWQVTDLTGSPASP